VTFPLETIGINDQYVKRGLDNLAQAFPIAPPNALGAIPTTGATLPTGTYNGQDFYYQLGSGGGVWHFKYNTSSGKWDFAGGPALVTETITNTDETTASTSYVALTTAGPAVALPFAGDYDVELGFYGFNNTAGQLLLMSYDIGGTGAVDADSCSFASETAGVGIQRPHRAHRKTGLTAVTLTAKYRVTGGTGTFRGLNSQGGARYMRVIPVKVG
jgi:hypothetical protein